MFPSRKESRVPQHSNSRADLFLPLPSFATNYPTVTKSWPFTARSWPLSFTPIPERLYPCEGHGSQRTHHPQRKPRYKTRHQALPTHESRRKTLQTEVGPSVPKVAPRPPTRYDASVCHRDGSNGFTHIPGTHLDDPRRKQRLCSPARVAVRRAPSPLLSINIYLYRLPVSK